MSAYGSASESFNDVRFWSTEDEEFNPGKLSTYGDRWKLWFGSGAVVFAFVYGIHNNDNGRIRRSVRFKTELWVERAK